MPARIVVVHDDPVFVATLATALGATGHSVATFVDPIAALDALDAAGKAEVVITRINYGTGRPNGVTLVRMARQKRPAIRALFIGRSEYVEYTEDLGEFLPSPSRSRMSSAWSNACSRRARPSDGVKAGRG